ncbi:MAG: FtsH protease activity modulator HflK [Gammaproteobacteria bacterium]|nr:FtsH protease activity modulator HflK [Pseudomonadales bacterium]MCP5348310.1 FtsH protease activity modulator HflK [Pseudomonadales bacterium]
MAWNEPGNNGDNNDPWGGGGRRGGNDGPPDIDEVVKNLTKKINSLFGGSGKSSGGSGSGGSGGSGVRFNSGLLGGLILTVVVVWGFMGFYTVDEAERGVVLRFGRVQEALVAPGLHWNPPIIDEVTKVNVQRLNSRQFVNDMLTTDENIINLTVTIQYRISDPANYVIAVQDPERSLQNASESAIRHVVGENYMDQILTTGRAAVADDVEDRLQEYMDSYRTGIFISQVNVTDAQPPTAVREAFDDVIRAREDEQRVQNQAQQYANRVIPEARGEAQQIIEQANAYQQEVIARAEGDASRFNQLLTEYSKAPEVTRERLYIDAIEDVMTNASKIMVDVEGGNNMMYLPLDKILEQGERNAASSALPNTSRELQDLANRLAPYLPAPGSSNSVDRSRLNTSGRGR